MPATAAILESGMAKAIIGGPLLRILQALIGFVDGFELGLAFCIARIAIRMILHGELAIGGF